MSEPSPGNHGGPSEGHRLLPPFLQGARPDALHHRMMLERCFDGREARWSDALIARTRRHIGGCVAAVEIAFRLELDAAAISGLGLADALPPDYCWRAVQHRPHMLSATLLTHFRDRAALSLMGQDAGDVPATFDEFVQNSAFTSEAAQTLSALALVQSGWRDAGPDHVAMRSDLPAEAMQDLVWTVAALIAEALARSDLMPAAQLLARIDRAGQALLARHDEQDSPFALASLLALQLRAAPLGEDQLLSLARARHVMALIGLIADRNGIEIRQLVTTLVEAHEQMLFRLCRAADLPREVAVRLVLGRRSVSRGVEDSVLVGYADGYDLMSGDEVRAEMMPLRLDGLFRDRLSHLQWREGGDVG